MLQDLGLMKPESGVYSVGGFGICSLSAFFGFRVKGLAVLEFRVRGSGFWSLGFGV